MKKALLAATAALLVTTAAYAGSEERPVTVFDIATHDWMEMASDWTVASGRHLRPVNRDFALDLCQTWRRVEIAQLARTIRYANENFGTAYAIYTALMGAPQTKGGAALRIELACSAAAASTDETVVLF
jgi:hypothetical protein